MIVLKIIGIAVLSLLVLVLAAVLLVLLVPVRYSLQGSYDGKGKGKGTLTWFLHAVSVTGTYEDGPEVTVRILGRPPGGRKKPSQSAGDEDLARDSRPEAGTEDVREDTRREWGEEEFVTGLPGDGEPPEEERWDGLFDDDEREAPEREEARKREKRPSQGRRKGKNLKERIEKSVDSLREKWIRIMGKKEQIQAFLADKENQKTIRLLLRQTKALIRHILPRKVRGNVTLGFEDPAVTGNVLAALSILYVWYGDAVKVTPVFDQAVLNVDGTIKGRLRLGTILVLVIRVLLNKNFRLLVRRWRGKRGK